MMDQNQKANSRYQVLALASCLLGLALSAAALVTGWLLLIAINMMLICVGMMFIILGRQSREGHIRSAHPTRPRWIVAVCSLFLSIVPAFFVAFCAGWAGMDNPNVPSPLLFGIVGFVIFFALFYPLGIWVASRFGK